MTIRYNQVEDSAQWEETIQPDEWCLSSEQETCFSPLREAGEFCEVEVRR